MFLYGFVDTATHDYTITRSANGSIKTKYGKIDPKDAEAVDRRKIID